MLTTAPAQVLLHDAMHYGFVSGLELEGYPQDDIALLVESARIVAKLHVVAVDRFALPVVGEEFGRLKDFGDEHGSLSSRCRREKMQILPNRTADSARDSDVVLQAGKPTLDSLGYQFRHDRPALHPKLPVVEE